MGLCGQRLARLTGTVLQACDFQNGSQCGQSLKERSTTKSSCLFIQAVRFPEVVVNRVNKAA